MAKKAQPQKDLFAPPSEDELQDSAMFAPPSEEELGEEDQPLLTAQGLLKGTAEALPMAGGMVGGALGLASPIPGGTLAGGALGGMTGQVAKELIEEFLLNEERPSREEYYTGLAQAGAEQAAGEAVGPLIGAGARAVGRGVKSAASSLSKIPEKVMETYYKRAPEVAKIEIGGVDGEDLITSADKIREGLQKAISSFKTKQNSQITQALETQGDNPVVMTGVIDALEENMAKLKPDLDAEKIAKLKKQIDTISVMGTPSGDDLVMSASDAYAVQKHLQDLAEYLPPGAALKKKDFVDITFERAASRARQAVGKSAPEINKANAELARLRRLDKNINKNLLAPDKPFGALMAAGSGENQLARRQLRQLGDITGANVLEPVEDLAAASYFNKAGILPREKTGSSLAPLALGTLYGGGMGVDEFSEGNIMGGIGEVTKGVALGSIASPLAIKTGIRAARGAGSLAGRLPPGTTQMAKQIPRALMQSIKESEPMIEGYPASQTQVLSSPQEAMIFENEIKNNPNLTPTQKAKQLNLIRKTGRIHVGQ